MSLQTVWKAGNSLVITIPAKLAATMHIKEGDRITLKRTAAGCLSLKPLGFKPRAPRYTPPRKNLPRQS